MPINGYTVGRDVTLRIVTGAGPLVFSAITGFRSKQDSTEQRIKKIDGETDHVRFMDGWSGSFTLDRQDNTVDRYFSQVESNYFRGIPDAQVSITETIMEVDGSVSQYRYLKVMLKLDDAGEFRGDSTVKQSLSFLATRRIDLT